jgi:hypothetical protein
LGHPSKNSTRAETYAMREEGGFVDFVKGEEIYPLIELLRVLKKDLY